ncbi:hypothetical protein BDF21DRAFT_495131, partial [Thamnidium elegans]
MRYPFLMLRRHSFPPLGVIIFNKLPLSTRTNSQQDTDEDDDRITVLGPLKQDPLTEENLALHTKNFPPCKDARRRNTRLFVQDQKPLILLQIKLEKQRLQEIELLPPIDTAELVTTRVIQIHRTDNYTWLQRLKRKKWIRFLIPRNNKHSENVNGTKSKYLCYLFFFLW